MTEVCSRSIPKTFKSRIFKVVKVLLERGLVLYKDNFKIIKYSIGDIRCPFPPSSFGTYDICLKEYEEYDKSLKIK